jgi:hypothetical protein
VTFVTDVISVTEVCAKTALRFVSWIVTQVRAGLLCAGNPHLGRLPDSLGLPYSNRVLVAKKHISAPPLTA